MKPSNQVERNKAFYRFVLLFGVTVVLIVAVVFLSIQVPSEENRQLRKSMTALQKEKQVVDSLQLVMFEAESELKRYADKNEVVEATNQRIQKKIAKMNALLKYIPDGENSLYGSMIRNLSQLSEAKSSLCYNG